MKSVMQTTFGNGKGNCFPACIASLLELSIDDVPNFCLDDNKTWLVDCSNWLDERSYPLIDFPLDLSGERPACLPVWFPVIASGKYPRGIQHSVIAQVHDDQDGLHFLHDPHPDGGWVDPVSWITVIFPKLVVR